MAEAIDRKTAPAPAPAAREIERKFVVEEPPSNLERFPFEDISQGYLAIGDEGREVRLRRRGGRTLLTVKQGAGRSRMEEEIELDAESSERLWPLTADRRVEKRRHEIPAGEGLTIELDVYAGKLEGLLTAEVEFDSDASADAFEPPSWLGAEVTDDPRYKNQRLATDGLPTRPTAAAPTPEPSRAKRREAGAFRLREDEGVSAGLRRIARGQIDSAVERLEGRTDEDVDEALHASRKSFKRVRALVRLARDQLGDQAYRRENATFRDAGRRLSGARDTQVAVETLDALCERYRDEIPDGAFAPLRASFVADHEAEDRRLRGAAAPAPHVVGELRAARRRLRGWRCEPDGLQALAPGFERIYRRGRRAFRAARVDRSDESFHELRKRVKDLWHVAQILDPAAPRRMEALAARAHKLSDLIGDDHDLAVLSERARERSDCFADEGDAERLEALIARRRRRLQRRALRLGGRVYALKPAAVARRIERAHAP